MLDDNPTRFKTSFIACNYTYEIGGNVTGLNGTLTIQNNGGDDLEITADGQFVFSTLINEGDNYNVTVLSQPLNQTCSIINYNESAYSNVEDIGINCWSTDAFTIANADLIERTEHTSNVLNEMIYVIGGFDNTGTYSTKVEIYDPVANHFNTEGSTS